QRSREPQNGLNDGPKKVSCKKQHNDTIKTATMYKLTTTIEECTDEQCQLQEDPANFAPFEVIHQGANEPLIPGAINVHSVGSTDAQLLQDMKPSTFRGFRTTKQPNHQRSREPKNGLNHRYKKVSGEKQLNDTIKTVTRYKLATTIRS